tara:strand:- start:43 stop:189 length:147 start_codon:yes stop_codon:yes gene_type:complete
MCAKPDYSSLKEGNTDGEKTFHFSDVTFVYQEKNDVVTSLYNSVMMRN